MKVSNYIARPGMHGLPPQDLREHITNVVKMSSKFATPVRGNQFSETRVKIVNAVKVAAWTHDLGKSLVENQEYLCQADGDADYSTRKKGHDHSTVGVLWLIHKSGCFDVNNANHWWLMGMIGNASVGHHSGLMDTEDPTDGNEFRSSYTKRLSEYLRKRPDTLDVVDEFVNAVGIRNKISNDWETALSEFEENIELINSLAPKDNAIQYKKFSIVIMTKMIFSALVDADHQDASDFALKCKIKAGLYSPNTKSKTELLRSLRSGHVTRKLKRRIDAFYSGMSIPNTEVNAIRDEFRGMFLNAAEKHP